ncbi:uncharacterized protein LOC115747488 [Rhodamnia argentea]|uniref:Uncharacterized protein LOC115747488 n=1 Tax=Rhodamnia argentea TaxID=178133 RepID=A0A8B8PXK7_9MYRT|nr:uncharacterized protein LOC115747488 [Rhodamnia argentea]
MIGELDGRRAFIIPRSFNISDGNFLELQLLQHSRRSFVSLGTMERPSSSISRVSGDHHVGLLCHYLLQNGSSQFVLLDVYEGCYVSVDRNHGFHTETNAHVFASCNGLLLLTLPSANPLSFLIYDLFAKRWIALPQPQITRRSISTAFAFDGQHYQVVRVFRVEAISVTANSPSASSEEDDWLEMEIFSSETGMWSPYCPLIRLPPELPKPGTTPLFANGAIYWEVGGYLLMCILSQHHCKLIRLPNHSQNWTWHTMTFGQCLWESEGLVHYCYSNFEGIHAWALLSGQDHGNYPGYSTCDITSFEWKLVHTVKHETLIARNPDVFRRLEQLVHTVQPEASFSCRPDVFTKLEQNRYCFSLSNWKPYSISPCGYSSVLKVIYLRLPGVILSYDLSTQILSEICTFDCPNLGFYCCSVFAVDFLPGESRTECAGSSRGKKELVHLPLADLITKAK